MASPIPLTRDSSMVSSGAKSSDASVNGVGSQFELAVAADGPNFIYLNGQELGVDDEKGRNGVSFLECLSDRDLDDSLYDIVFVHGLCPDRRSTWRCNDMFWPDSIAQDMPTARVWLFNYDTSIWTSPSVGKVTQTANDLTLLLDKARLGVSGRGTNPIIWIAHSLGGFVVKQVCILPGKTAQAVMNESISASTKGIIFIGTPHRALSVGGWPSILQRIRDVARTYFNDCSPVKPLDSSGIVAMLESLSQFDSFLDRAGIRVVSFYEQHEASGSSMPVLVTSFQNALHHSAEVRDTLPGDHISMCQLQSRSDPGYLAIRNRVDELYKGVPHIVAPPSALPSSKLERTVREVQDVLDRKVGAQVSAEYESSNELLAIKRHTPKTSWDDGATAVPPSIFWGYAQSLKLRRLERYLAFPNYDVTNPLRVQGIIPHSDSADWVLESKEFRNWLDADGLFVIYGAEGSGKSTLAARIARYLEAQMDSDFTGHRPQRYVLSYFNTAMETEHAITQMLNQYLLQFLEISPFLARHFSTRRVFTGPRPKWPDWDEENRPRDSSKERSALDLDALLTEDDHDHEFSHNQLVVSPFTVSELAEILLSILHDDKVNEAIFIIDGIADLPEGSRSQAEDLIEMLSYLRTGNVKVCLTHDSEWAGSWEKVFQVSTHKNRPAARSSEDPLDDLFQTVREDPMTESLRYRLVDCLEKAADHSFLYSTLVRQIISSAPTYHQLDDFLRTQEEWSGVTHVPGNKRVDAIFQWILDSLPRDHNGHSIAGYLFVVALASRPLTPAEARSLVPRSLLRDTWEHKASGDGKSHHSADGPHDEFEETGLVNTIESALCGLLRFTNGVFVLCHPCLKKFILHHLRERDLTAALQYHMAISCLETMGHSNNGNITYDWHRREHTKPVSESGYAFRYWSTHLRAAHSAQGWTTRHSRTVLDLLIPLWSNVELCGVMRQFSQARFPPSESLPLSCLLAGYDLWKILDIPSPPSTSGDGPSRLSLELRCATVNCAEAAVMILSNHGHDIRLHDASGHDITRYRMWARAEELADNLSIPKWTRDLLDNHVHDKGEDNRFTWAHLREELRKPDVLRLLRSEGYLNPLLVLSVRRCDEETAAWLLESKANCNYVDTTDSQRPSLLHIAAALGDVDLTVRLVKHGALISEIDKYGMRPIHRAAERGHHQVVELLVSTSLDQDTRFGQSPLFMACDGVSAATVSALLKFGFNINLKDNRGRRPLHVAASTGAPDMVRFLISRGADPDASDYEGICPLHVAALAGWAAVVAELLSAGTSIDAETNAGQTPLHYACKSPNPSLNVVLFLLQRQSDPNKHDKNGLTPLHIAVRSGSLAVVELLVKLTTNVTAEDREKFVELAGDRKQLLNLLDSPGNPPDAHVPSIPDSLDPMIAPPKLNVVLVHGYHGTALSTWSSGPWFWPENWLPADIGPARILCWGHRISFTDFSNMKNVRDLAMNLLQYVSNHVGTSSHGALDSQSAPLVFIGHSLGGLVIKKAIALASQDPRLAKLVANTASIVFMGTPHRGTHDHTVSLEELVSRLVESAVDHRLAPTAGPGVSFTRVRNNPGRLAARDFLDLRRVETIFKDACHQRGIRLLSIVESSATLSGHRPLVPAYCASYDIPSARTMASPRNHSNLGKFLSRDDPVYQAIIAFLLPEPSTSLPVKSDTAATPSKFLTSQVKSTVPVDDSPREKEPDFQRALLTELGRYHEPNFVPSTGHQIPSSLVAFLDGEAGPESAIQHWLSSRKDRCLWITGKPGSGKTTLMARLWQHKKTVDLLRQSFAIGENHLIVSAFFFDRRRPHGKAPEDMLRSLLFQVFSAQPDLIWISLPKDVQHYRGEPLADWLATWDNIRDAFEKAVSASNETTFCFFIDALDESEAAATGRRGSNNMGAYDVLIDFVRSCERHTNIKLCISSRTLPQFSFRFREIPRVAVQDYNREDIEIYVKHRLSDVTALEDDVVEDLVNAVVKGSEGVMLWAVMVVEQLLRGIEIGASNSDLWKQLRSVPRSLADLYKRMMAEIPRKHRRESARIFRLLVTAPGPLDLELLDLAAEDYIEGSSAGRKSNLRAANAVIGERSPRSEDPSAFQVRMKRRISNLCVDFLTVHDDGQVQFIHSTAKMFVSEHLEDFSPQEDDPGFDAPVNLLSGTIMRLKEALQPFFRGGRVLSFPRGLEKEQSTVARYVQEAVVAAVCADAQAKDENSYLRLVDELGTTCFTVRSLRDPRNTAAAGGSKPVRRRFQGLSQEHYSSLLAIKAGLWKYVASTTDDVTVELKDESGRSLLWYALNRQELRHLPWGDVTPVAPEDRDLPDPKVVRDLLSLGSHANESGLWQKVLEAGYHCFATDIVPDHPGPEQTAENGEKWVSITTHFLEHGADASIAFMTRFRNRFIEAASPPDFPEASSANEPFEKEITPRTTLNETIRVQRLYHEQYRRMLAMVKERAGPGLSDSDRHGHGPWSSGDMYLHPGLPLVATPMELPADGSSTPPLWLEKPEPRPMPPHSPPPHDPTAMLPPPADRVGRSSLRLASFPFRRSKGKDKHKGKDKGNGDGDEHPSTSSPEPTPKFYSVAERALLVRPHFRKTSSSASASGEQMKRA